MKLKTLLFTLIASISAFAQEGAPAQEQPNALVSFLPMILIFVVMWFFFIRPKQKEVKQMEQMRSALREGDNVMTAAGIIGKITAIDNTKVTIKTGSSTLEFEKAAILRVIQPEVKSAG